MEVILGFLLFNVTLIVRMVGIFTLMMHYRNWVDKESTQWKVVKPFWYTVAGLFAAVDIIYNWFLSLLFWDKPAVWDETVSYRMDRYIEQYKSKTDSNWSEKGRYYFAVALCTVLSWSAPKHCGNI